MLFSRLLQLFIRCRNMFIKLSFKNGSHTGPGRVSSWPSDHWSSQLGLQNTLTASLQWGKTPPPHTHTQSVLDYDIKQFDDEAFSNAGALGMRSTPSLSLLSRSTQARVAAPGSPINRLNRTKLCNYAKLNCLKLTVFFLLLFSFNCV